MTDPLQVSALQTLVLQQTSLKSTLFAPNSRYAWMDTATLSLPHGKTIIYLTRRFLPPAERFQLLQEHTVTQGERLDNITAQYMVDPTLFWRLCDANNAMRPEELTETIGRKLRITFPEGIPGAPNA
ncbi:MAG: LysM domain-containing protein [Candidatus Dormibacteraceae bacterium]